MIRLTSLFIALLIINSLSAQSIQFQKTYDGPGTNDRCFSVAQTSDSGYILAGETNSFGAGNRDAFLAKTDSNGTVQWTKVYGGTAADMAHRVHQTSDGGFIVAGGTENAGNVLVDIWIFKTDALGIISWQRAIGSPGGDSGTDIMQTSDGGYIASGFMNGGVVTNDDACLVKLDGLGNIQWVHSYSIGTLNDYANSVAQTTDGGYVIGGSSGDSTTTAAGLVIKTDANGNVQWANTYSGTDWIKSILVLPSGDIMIAGASSQISPLNAWLAKLNANGIPVWSKSYAGVGYDVNWVTSTADGGFALCGHTGFSDAAFLIKTDSTGAIGWSKAYGGSVYETADQVITSVNGGYALASSSDFSFSLYESGYFIKTDANGNSGCNQNTPLFQAVSIFTPPGNVAIIDSSLTNIIIPAIGFSTAAFTETSLCFTVGGIELTSAEDLISIFPNPANDRFTISGIGFAIEEIEIYSSVGEKIFSQKQAGYNQQQKVNVDAHSWSVGVYLVRIKTGDGIFVKRLVKQ